MNKLRERLLAIAPVIKQARAMESAKARGRFLLQAIEDNPDVATFLFCPATQSPRLTECGGVGTYLGRDLHVRDWGVNFLQKLYARMQSSKDVPDDFRLELFSPAPDGSCVPGEIRCGNVKMATFVLYRNKQTDALLAKMREIGIGI